MAIKKSIAAIESDIAFWQNEVNCRKVRVDAWGEGETVRVVGRMTFTKKDDLKTLAKATATLNLHKRRLAEKLAEGGAA